MRLQSYSHVESRRQTHTGDGFGSFFGKLFSRIASKAVAKTGRTVASAAKSVGSTIIKHALPVVKNVAKETLKQTLQIGGDLATQALLNKVSEAGDKAIKHGVPANAVQSVVNAIHEGGTHLNKGLQDAGEKKLEHVLGKQRPKKKKKNPPKKKAKL